VWCVVTSTCLGSCAQCHPHDRCLTTRQAALLTATHRKHNLHDFLLRFVGPCLRVGSSAVAFRCSSTDSTSIDHGSAVNRSDLAPGEFMQPGTPSQLQLSATSTFRVRGVVVKACESAISCIVMPSTVWIMASPDPRARPKASTLRDAPSGFFFLSL